MLEVLSLDFPKISYSSKKKTSLAMFAYAPMLILKPEIDNDYD